MKGLLTKGFTRALSADGCCPLPPFGLLLRLALLNSAHPTMKLISPASRPNRFSPFSSSDTLSTLWRALVS